MTAETTENGALTPCYIRRAWGRIVEVHEPDDLDEYCAPAWRSTDACARPWKELVGGYGGHWYFVRKGNDLGGGGGCPHHQP